MSSEAQVILTHLDEAYEKLDELAADYPEQGSALFLMSDSIDVMRHHIKLLFGVAS